MDAGAFAVAAVLTAATNMPFWSTVLLALAAAIAFVKAVR